MTKRLLLALLLFAAPAFGQLQLSDFDVPDGRMAVVLALFTSGGNSSEPFRESNTGAFVEGDRTVGPAGGQTATLTINRIRIQGGGSDIVFNRSGSGNFTDYFQDLQLTNNAVYDDYQWTIQTATTSKTWDQNDQRGTGGNNIGNGGMGGGFGRLDDNGSSGVAAPLTTVGERFLIAITVLAPVDNCDLYLGSNDLTSPGGLRLGALTPLRFYLGSSLVCGPTP